MPNESSTVLVATDFSRASTVAVSFGTALAKLLNCRLSLVHVFGYTPTHRYPVGVGWMVQEIRRRTLRQLRLARGKVFSQGVPVDAYLLEGKADAATQILERCAELPGAIAVLGTHSRDPYERFFIGSTAEHVLRHAAGPVVTVGPHVKPYWGRPLRKIMLATDLTERSLAPVAVLKAMGLTDITLTVLHVAAPSSPILPASWADEIRSRLTALLGQDFVHEKVEFQLVVNPNAVEAIRDAAKDGSVDLLAIGMHPGRSMTTHLNPRTGFQVVMSASCAVLTVCE